MAAPTGSSTSGRSTPGSSPRAGARRGSAASPRTTADARPSRRERAELAEEPVPLADGLGDACRGSRRGCRRSRCWIDRRDGEDLEVPVARGARGHLQRRPARAEARAAAPRRRARTRPRSGSGISVATTWNAEVSAWPARSERAIMSSASGSCSRELGCAAPLARDQQQHGRRHRPRRRRAAPRRPRPSRSSAAETPRAASAASRPTSCATVMRASACSSEPLERARARADPQRRPRGAGFAARRPARRSVRVELALVPESRCEPALELAPRADRVNRSRVVRRLRERDEAESAYEDDEQRRARLTPPRCRSTIGARRRRRSARSGPSTFGPDPGRRRTRR